MPAADARPRQVTWSAAIIMIGSAFILLSAYQVVAGIGTLETRESVEEFLADAPDGLGLGVGDALDVLRVTAMAAAALAVTTAILGWQVLLKSRSARVVLSVLALPVFVTGTVTGGLISAVVVASVITLWLSPAREWYAGLPIPDPPARRPREKATTPTPQQQAFLPPATPPTQEPTQPPTQEGAPPVGPTGPASGPAPYAQPFGQPAHPGTGQPVAHQPGRRGPRPAALMVACLVSWSLCALTMMLVLGSIAYVWASPDAVLDAVREQDPSVLEQGVTVRGLQVTMTVIFGLLALWCVGASVAAAVALRGSAPARVTLLVCAALAGAVALLATLASPVLAVPLLGCVLVVALLMRPEVRAWR
ncbi:hypothetical protein [Nocardioides sp. AX2bis]|uniref:hypothetical protein n=1 Tax=Nocardioides sp. AX2bis TaxID=2653157 RepID=UPI0012F0D6C1|nr:hypothetical protein [Nocardioides sp. AX2bis]VXC30116.1 conserved membrane hypothetical protein [Nocardioides sp. AX2bis]